MRDGSYGHSSQIRALARPVRAVDGQTGCGAICAGTSFDRAANHLFLNGKAERLRSHHLPVSVRDPMTALPNLMARKVRAVTSDRALSYSLSVLYTVKTCHGHGQRSEVAGVCGVGCLGNALGWCRFGESTPPQAIRGFQARAWSPQVRAWSRSPGRRRSVTAEARASDPYASRCVTPRLSCVRPSV